jgi:hypothetical protein
VTLCGDGKNLWSGYAFVLAGWDNTRTRLYRRAAWSRRSQARASFARTVNNDHNWHRHWFDIRAEANVSCAMARRRLTAPR